MTTTNDTNTFAPVTIGVSPGGVTWVAYDPAKIDSMRQALAALWAKASVRLVRELLASDQPELKAAAQAEVDRREAAYLSLRTQVMRLKGKRNTDKARAQRNTPAGKRLEQEYFALAERLEVARRMRVR